MSRAKEKCRVPECKAPQVSKGKAGYRTTCGFHKKYENRKLKHPNFK